MTPSTSQGLMRRALYYGAIALAVLTLALACRVLLGWHLHVPAWLRLSPDTPPMQYNTALGFALGAVGLLASTWRRQRAAVSMALLVLLLSGLTLTEHGLNAHLFIDNLFVPQRSGAPLPGRMAAVTATAHFILGLALLFHAHQRLAGLAVLTAVMVLAAALVSLFGYLLDIEVLFGRLPGLGMAPHTAMGFALFSGAMMLEPAQHDRASPQRLTATYLGALALGVLVMGMCLWQAIAAIEQRGLERETLEVAERARTLVAREMELRVPALVRSARRLELRPEMPEHEWAADTTHVFHDAPGYRGIALVSGAGDALWAVPAHARPDLDALVREWPEIFASTGAHADDHVLLLAEPTAQEPDNVLAVVVPAHMPGDMRHYVVALIGRSVFEAALAGGDAYSTSIDMNGVEIARAGDGRGTSPWRRADALTMHGMSWEVAAKPTPATVAAARSLLRSIVLVLFAILSAALPLLLWSLLGLRRAQTTIARVASQLEAAQQISRVGSWELDIERGQVVWSKELYRIFGLSSRQPPPPFPAQERLFAPSSWQRWEAAVSHTRSSGQGHILTLELAARGNEPRVVVARVEAARGPSGAVERLVGTFQDVTEQHRTNEQLAQTSERLRLATSAARIGVWDWSIADDRLIYDDMMHELFGVRAATGRDAYAEWRSIVHPDDVDELARRFRAAVSGQESFRATFRIRHPSGNEVHLRAAATVHRDPATGAPRRVVGINWDITEQRVAELALVELNRRLEERSTSSESASQAKSRFLANMSHEIRTPIGAITGVTYLLGKTPLTREQADLLATIETSAKSLHRMINEVLDLSKVEAGQLALEVDVVSVAQVVSDVSRVISGFAAGKDLELIIDVHPEVPAFVMGDRGRLAQILTNLSANAIKFTARGSVIIRVTCPHREDHRALVRLEVSDTGPGISPDLLPKLFTPFTQGSESQRVGGTGLGLALVKEFTNLMGGEVGLESTPGVGSTFWCEIPLDCADAVPGQAELGIALRVLVVDDHDAQRAALTACARRLGWRVESVAGGEEALACIMRRIGEGRAFDAVVLDWRMPGMDGMETLRRLRASIEDPGNQPFVVVVTAYDVSDLSQQEKLELADAVIAKPVTQSSLFDAIAGASSAHHAPVPAPGVAKLPALADARVLVVDDSEINRGIVRRILEMEGAVVHTARDGGEAIEMALRGPEPYHVILMDMQMPHVDGVTATLRIREVASPDALPILALTAEALAEERRRALDAGMNDFVTKPFEPADLIAKIRLHAPLHPEPREDTGSQTADGGWPALAGIDTRGAQSRLLGDVELFRELLFKLLDDTARSFATLARPATDAQWSHLALQMHKLRGAAGNLGALELREAGAEGEAAALAHKWLSCERAAARLRTEAARIRASAEAAFGCGDRDESAELNAHEDSEDLSVFVAHLEHHDLEALPLLKRLSPALRRRLGEERHAALARAVGDLEFAKAIELVS